MVLIMCSPVGLEILVVKVRSCSETYYGKIVSFVVLFFATL